MCSSVPQILFPCFYRVLVDREDMDVVAMEATKEAQLAKSSPARKIVPFLIYVSD